jgi:exonuclease SbcC
MVPARLTVRNFLCYGDDCPPLELEGIGLACLTGANGHGKSALMDAITWALWGKARGRTVDALVHHGRDSMEVDFEFLVGASRYRVIRRRTRVGGRGPSRADLQFQIWTGSEWKPLTGNSLYESERAIEQTVKLSYETFINSALLLQGKADLFTAAGAADRKKVLAEILSLEQYDLLEAKAKELRRERAHDASLLAAALADMEPEVIALPEHEDALTRTRAELDQVAAARAEAARELEGVRAAVRALERQRAELSAAEDARRREALAVETAMERVAALTASIEEDSRMAAAAPAIHDGYARLQAARDADRRLSEALMRHRQIEQRMAPLIQSIEQARRRLESQLDSTQHDLRREREAAATRESLEKEVAALDARSAALTDQEAQLAGLAHHAQEVRAEIARLKEENSRLRESVDHKKARLDDLRGAEQRGELDCPLCRTRLGIDHLHRIEELWHAEGKTEADRIRANRSRIADLEADLLRAQRATENIQTQLETERRALDRRIGLVRGQLDEVQKAAGRVADLHVESERLAALLAADDFAQEARRQVAALEAERDAHAYDADAHRSAHERVVQLEHYEEKERVIAQTLTRLEASREAKEVQELALAEARDRLCEAEARVASLAQAVAAQPDLTQRLSDLETRAEQLEQAEARLRGALGGLEATVARGRELARQYEEKSARCARLRDEEAIYDELARAFGRNGVQALIIDAVLPEVETEANRLLGGMTNGRMSVTLDTQRTLKSGETAEALEIRIADEWGTRDYEMYSGGESFRINLALRIALAKLLARRSGAPLPTLIIDEGFGSQDAAGQERMIEAVTAIQEDFQCLLVVTHIEEMKQLFDRRIEVTKHAGGSIARVVTA